jgi:polysaccharide export outer membrane protein
MTARLAILLIAATLSAQQPPSPGFQVRNKENKLSTDDVIKAFEAPRVDDYTLGAGDELTIDVWGHPELSAHHVVGPDGKITIPVAGVLKVTDLTREGAQIAVSSALAKFYSDLLVTVRVDKYTSFRVNILGRVSSPGALLFDSQPTLLDVVTRAGGLPIGGVGADKAGLGRCAIIRRDQMIWMDLKELVSHGNLAVNIRLARNDLVYMPDAGDQLVYVLGEVQRPGAFRLTPDMTFFDAFTQAGGLNEDANDQKLELISTVTGAQKELKLKDLLNNPKATNFSLEEGDIIFAPKRNMAKFGYVLQKTGPITSFAILGTTLGKN